MEASVMKKLIPSILFIVLLLGLMGCENQKETVSSAVDSKQQSNKVYAITNKQGIPTTQELQKSQYSKGTFLYIAFNGYYYKQGTEVDKSKLGTKIGEVKRIGDWEIVKDGDSNAVPQGPIYSVINKDPKDVIAAKRWSNRDVYLLFEKEGPVKQTDKSTIFSSKNDPEEVQIAIQNVRKNSSVLYEFQDKNRLQLTSVSYDPNHNSTVSLSYRVPEVDTSVQGFLSLLQYPKNEIPEVSEFIKKIDKNGKWKSPVLKESFTLNGIEWSKYETYNQENVYRAEKQNLYFEIKAQGKIDLNLMKEFLNSFQQTK